MRLLGRDGNGMLLEYAGDRLLSQHLAEHGDDAATAIATDVMARLLSPSKHTPPPHLQPLRERYVALFRVARADRAAGRASLYVHAADIAERLLADPYEIRPLHGDLHHDNILFGPRGWLAIDPKGVIGDPGFDAANMFYNPLDRDDLCLDPRRIAHMADMFGKTLGQSPHAILDHAIAYGCLSAAWHREDKNAVDENRELTIAEAVRRVRLQF